MGLMQRARTTKFLAALVIAVTGVSLAGCAGGSEGSETDPIPGDGSSSSDSDSGDPGDDTDSDSPRCLIGGWVATGEKLERWYRSFVEVDGVVVNSVSGEILLTFDDSDFIYSTREITVEMTISDQAATTTISGGTAGSYLAFPDGLMSTSIDTSDLAGTATVSGIEFTTDELGIDLTGAGAFTGYECTDGNLILETQSAGPGIATMELEPAG